MKHSAEIKIPTLPVTLCNSRPQGETNYLGPIALPFLCYGERTDGGGGGFDWPMNHFLN